MCYSVTIDLVKARAKADKEAAEVGDMFMFGPAGGSAKFYARKPCPVISLEDDAT